MCKDKNSKLIRINHFYLYLGAADVLNLFSMIRIKKIFTIFLISVFITNTVALDSTGSVENDLKENGEYHTDSVNNELENFSNFDSSNMYNRFQQQNRGLPSSVKSVPVNESMVSQSGRKMLLPPVIDSVKTLKADSSITENRKDRVGKKEKKTLLITGAAAIVAGLAVVIVKISGKDKKESNQEIPEPPLPPEF